LDILSRTWTSSLMNYCTKITVAILLFLIFLAGTPSSSLIKYLQGSVLWMMKIYPMTMKMLQMRRIKTKKDHTEIGIIGIGIEIEIEIGTGTGIGIEMVIETEIVIETETKIGKGTKMEIEKGIEIETGIEKRIEIRTWTEIGNVRGKEISIETETKTEIEIGTRKGTGEKVIEREKVTETEIEIEIEIERRMTKAQIKTGPRKQRWSLKETGIH